MQGVEGMSHPLYRSIYTISYSRSQADILYIGNVCFEHPRMSFLLHHISNRGI